MNHDHWIDAQPVAPHNNARIKRYSPADGRLLAEVAEGTAEDLQRAAAAARRAFDAGPWRRM